MPAPRTPSYRDEAEALAQALDIDAVDVGEVIAWVDAQIAAQDKPHFTLCQLAQWRDKYPQDVAAGLRQLPAEANPGSVWSLLIQLIARKAEGDTSCAFRIAASLSFLNLGDPIEVQELCAVASGTWDAFDLAANGTIREGQADIVQQMRAVLGRLSEAAKQRGPCWNGPWAPG